MKPFIDLSEQRFGRLVAVQRVAGTKTSPAKWLCYCDCGGSTLAATGSLRAGSIQSCGCFYRLHGHTSVGGKRVITRTYRIWTNMKTRCTNPNASNARWYRDKGVTYCDRWKDFSAFLADMGEAPAGLTLDRIDVSKGYEPGNCRWATWKEQQNNRSNNVARRPAAGVSDAEKR